MSMKRFITRIYSLNTPYPFCQKITVLFIELIGSKISARFIGPNQSDVSISLKHKFYCLTSYNGAYDLDYFNVADNYSLTKQYAVSKSRVQVKNDGI